MNSYIQLICLVFSFLFYYWCSFQHYRCHYHQFVFLLMRFSFHWYPPPTEITCKILDYLYFFILNYITFVDIKQYSFVILFPERLNSLTIQNPSFLCYRTDDGGFIVCKRKRYSPNTTSMRSNPIKGRQYKPIQKKRTPCRSRPQPWSAGGFTF